MGRTSSSYSTYYGDIQIQRLNNQSSYRHCWISIAFNRLLHSTQLAKYHIYRKLCHRSKKQHKSMDSMSVCLIVWLLFAVIVLTIIALKIRCYNRRRRSKFADHGWIITDFSAETQFFNKVRIFGCPKHTKNANFNRSLRLKVWDHSISQK